MFTPSRNIIDHKYGGREKNVFAETNEWAMVGAEMVLSNGIAVQMGLTRGDRSVSSLPREPGTS